MDVMSTVAKMSNLFMEQTNLDIYQNHIQITIQFTNSFLVNQDSLKLQLQTVKST